MKAMSLIVEEAALIAVLDYERTSRRAPMALTGASDPNGEVNLCQS